VQRIPVLDIPRSTVTAVTLDTVARHITNLQFDVVNAPALIDSNLATFQAANYFSIVDKYGNVKMNHIPYTGIDTATGIVTVPTSFVYKEGQTIDVGDTLVTGYNASSHSHLPDEAERYLELYCTRYIFRRDSSDDGADSNQELEEIKADLLEKYSDINDDVDYVATIDDSFMF
jgi:hypothetical protein